MSSSQSGTIWNQEESIVYFSDMKLTPWSLTVKQINVCFNPVILLFEMYNILLENICKRYKMCVKTQASL